MAIECRGDLRKLPLTLALKIYEIEIMRVIRYGMGGLSPKLAKGTMRNLDKSKTMFLKAAPGVSKHTPNTFVLALTKENTLCESLEELGYEFDENAWTEYNNELDNERANIGRNDYIDGPAFHNDA